ncbi:MAG: hypothetical protein KGQ41_06745 [Alphaproteobacteria bacterium]|nr:hypothetical protein [Alphaproteobacteria bacterium]
MKRLVFTAICCLSLASCASDTATSRSLSEILQAERGQQKVAEGCKVPADMVGKPHTEIQKLKLTAPVRVIFPGDPVGSDSVANRLNFKVDKKGVITAITCG